MFSSYTKYQMVHINRALDQGRCHIEFYMEENKPVRNRLSLIYKGMDHMSFSNSHLSKLFCGVFVYLIF